MANVPSVVTPQQLAEVVKLHTPGIYNYSTEETYCDDPECYVRHVVRIPRCPVCVESWGFETSQTYPCATLRALGVTS